MTRIAEPSDALEAEALHDLDRRFVLHPATSILRHLADGPRIVGSAQGIEIVDADGRRFIDGISGLWCVNVGYGRDEIVDAMARQARELAFYHGFGSASNEPQIRLAERLVRMAPGRMSRAFFCNSGSEANDTQVKIIRYYNNLRGKPLKKKIISRRGAYHGTTLAAASLTGQAAFHANFDLPIPDVLYADAPDMYRRMPEQGMTETEYSKALGDALERLILEEGPETVAAFIAEPVMAGAGVLPPPAGYFQAVKDVLRRHDVLLVVDEVICGFGRLGRMFGAELFGAEPDLVTVAKGLTSGYFPMAACLVSEEIWTVMARAPGMFAHGFTYSGHPVAAATALANLDVIEREGLPGNADRMGAVLANALADRLAANPFVGDVRCRGLLAGVEFVIDRAEKRPFPESTDVASAIAGAAMALGLIVRPLGNVVALAPPLTVTDSQIAEMVERLGQAAEAAAELANKAPR